MISRSKRLHAPLPVKHPRVSAPASKARFLAGIMAAFIALAGLPGGAQAQNVDWVLNASDAGFDPTVAGGPISYSLNVTNGGFGPADASATTLSLTILAGATFTGASGTITGCTPTPSVGPSTVICNVPALAPLAAATLVANVLTSTSGSVSFGASVPKAGDSNTGNIAIVEGTPVTAGADISLSLTAPVTAAAGSTVAYSFAATNNGPDPATNVVLQFPVPTGIANATPPSGCTLAGVTYSCTIAGPIAVGGSVTLEFSGQVSAASGSTITGVGNVSGGTPPDPIALNNGATRNTSITAGSDLSIAKSRSPSGTLLMGDAVIFNLVSRYTGGSPSGIVVSDTIPANYSISGFTAPGWICTVTGQLVECTKTTGSGPGANVALGPISDATTVVLSGTPTNAATISSAGPIDPVPGNNTATDGGSTIADPTIDLRANKSGPVPPLVVVGNSYSFAISTSNIGNAAFVGTVEMVDTIPAGLQVTSYGLNGWA
jgi:uncharacterized repeat protein (TIGR01451 family)